MNNVPQADIGLWQSLYDTVARVFLGFFAEALKHSYAGWLLAAGISITLALFAWYWFRQSQG